MPSTSQYQVIMDGNADAGKAVLDELADGWKTREELEAAAIGHYRSERHQILVGRKLHRMRDAGVIAERGESEERYGITENGVRAYEELFDEEYAPDHGAVSGLLTGGDRARRVD